MKTILKIAILLFVIYWVFNFFAWGFKKVVFISIAVGVIYLIGRFVFQRRA